MENNINIDGMEITFDDVINYWITLFPELKKKEDFENILKQISNLNLKELKAEYYDENPKIDVEKYFNNKSRTVDLESILFSIQEKYPWVFLIEPIIQQYAKEFYIFLNSVKNIEDKKELFKSVISTIAGRVDQVTYKVMILETNIARMEKKLRGDTSEEKSLYFRNVLLRDKDFLKSLFLEYEELTIIVDRKIKNTFEFFKTIISKTDSEFYKLKSVFKKDLGKLHDITIGAGDTHNGGKSVSVLMFSCGTKLIYKPRNLELEEAFYKFISWINNQPIKKFLNLKAAKVHMAADAGWVECISHESCNNLDEIRNFYYRIGEILGILYAVNAKDFHFENLIAQGEYPVLIDLETFLHPDLHAVDRANSTANEVASEIISCSVDGIGLLPSPIINNKTNQAVDVGGLSGDKEQLSPFKSMFIKDISKDNIRIIKDYAYITPNKNNPQIDGVIQKSDNYIEIIKEGFEKIYLWILKNRSIFIDKVEELFGNKECRVLFRSTYIYSQILNTSYHPDLLRKPIDRKVYLHRIGILASEEIKEIVVSEIDDLIEGDIPYFITNTNINKVFNGKKKEIKSKILRSSIDTIKYKLNNFSLDDLERQIGFIDITYITKLNKTDEDITYISFEKDKGEKNWDDKEKWMRLSIDIAEKIIDKSITGKNGEYVDRTWLGSFSSDRNNNIVYLSKVGPDLYGGNSGIAVFFAYLAKVTKNDKYKKIALESIEPIKFILENIDERLINNVGAFTGISGEIYATYQVGKALEVDELIKISENKILEIEKIILNNEKYDVIGGIAGALGVVLSFYDKSDNNQYKEKLLNLANKIFEKYKKNIRRLDDSVGVTWDNEGYVGFSHGNAGIIAYLGKLYSITKDKEILNIVNESLKYERSMYNEKEKNWYNKYSKENLAFGWCHGAQVCF